MENWFERVSQNLEAVLSDHCEMLDAMFRDGALELYSKTYEKVPSIEIDMFCGDIPPLVIKYDIQGEYFYRDMTPDDIEEEVPPLRMIFDNVDRLVFFIHRMVHSAVEEDEEFDYEEDLGSQGVGEISTFDNKADFFEHIEKITNKRESNDKILKNVKWISNVESTAKIDIPEKKEIKTQIYFGKIEDTDNFVIKKSIISNENRIGNAELSYLWFNKEEAEVIKAELEKYTAS